MRWTLILWAVVAGAAVGTSSVGDWPQWRGPFNTGMAAGDAPVNWSETRNVRWARAIPGRGHSTPVIAGGKLFLTTAVPTGKIDRRPSPTRAGGGADGGLEHRFEVIAIDRDTGRVAWQRTATVASPHEGYHRVYGSFASNSPVTDGTRVFAFFGSRGLYAYNLEGTLLWQKDFGVRMRMDQAFGEGTPLTLHDERLLLHFDHLDTGFLVMLDPATGREIWRTKRPEPYNWAAPYVASHDGRRQIVMSGLTVRGYDFETGTLLWEVEGLGENTIPQPVQHHDLVFAMSGHTVRRLMAIRLGRTGNLAGTDAIAWSTAGRVVYTLTASPQQPALRAHRQRAAEQLQRYHWHPAVSGAHAETLQLQGLSCRRGGQALPCQRRRRRHRRGHRRCVQRTGDQHHDGALVHRVAGDCRGQHLPAQPHAPVSHRRELRDERAAG
jgi:outer membrane protein assembly factor BamB